MAKWEYRFTDNADWLDSLKVGDKVAFRPYGGSYEIRAVDHATATQIHVGMRKYRRKDGGEVGKSYERDDIQPVTQKVYDSLELDELQRQYDRLYDKLPRYARSETAEELRPAIAAIETALKALNRLPETLPELEGKDG